MKRLDISTGELLEAMIAGKLEDWNKLDFKMYLEENGLDNRIAPVVAGRDREEDRGVSR